MATLIVPDLEDPPWPTLGPQVCQLLEERSIFGPGSLKGEPYVLDDEKRAIIYRAYEVYPQGHQWAGRRRFKRVAYSCRKGLAKTELLAQIAFAELHPDGPVRCDGFDSRGRPVGRPVVDPYIPLLATQKEQVEELAFGALYLLCSEGPDANEFDVTLERIIRLGPSGAADGKAEALANNPNARDGARTTFQGFDEPHRMYAPRLVAAHETMVANLEKRVLEDPWGFYVGTAGEPGQGSIAEQLHREAEDIAKGEQDEPQLFYFHRWASSESHPDLKTVAKRVAAITEATGPIGEYGPGQFHSIARQWDRPLADKAYLERVWLNRWGQSGSQAFDVRRWEGSEDEGGLATRERIPDGAFVTVGFDGARFRDATGLVITDIVTGIQRAYAVWERPDVEGAEADEWEVPEAEVTEAVAQIHRTYVVWRGYYDPPHWTETVGAWAGRYPDQVVEWWTNRTRAMAYAVRGYSEAHQTHAVRHEVGRNPEVEAIFDRHMGAAGRQDVNIWDDEAGVNGELKRMFVLRKIHPSRRFDLAMAATLSWEARLDAIREGAQPKKRLFVPVRVR